jgi:hypothetical protein
MARFSFFEGFFLKFVGKEGEGHLGLWSQNSEMNGRIDWSVEISKG